MFFYGFGIKAIKNRSRIVKNCRYLILITSNCIVSKFILVASYKKSSIIINICGNITFLIFYAVIKFQKSEFGNT